MTIPLDNLQNWSRRGLGEMSKQTFNILSGILVKKIGISRSDIFLQGSYSNSTNVRDNSDIDIVMEFGPDRDVKKLKDYVFSNINGVNGFYFTKGAKTVKFNGSNLYVSADIVPCITVDKTKGCVALYDSNNDVIIYNYPKIHILNGRVKSGNTHGNYKKAVRLMKNAKNYLLDKGHSTNVSSYVIECMLYNVPDELFSGNESEFYEKILCWLYDNKGAFKNMCTQDEKRNLFDVTNVSMKSAKHFINRLVDMWDNWEKYRND